MSRTHCNFIVNKGGATTRDFLELAEMVKHAVYDNFMIELKMEVKLIE